jgi:hypothetical protein
MKTDPNSEGRSLRKEVFDTFLDGIDVISYAKNRLGVTLFPSQGQMARAIVDPKIKRVAILCSRQFGKTETVSIAALFLADTRPNTKILLFAPQWSQVKIAFKRIRDYAKNNKEKLFSKIITANLEGIEFENGSTIQIRPAGEDTNIVGLTGDIIILDESQDINDFVVQKKIMPMLIATGGKMIKIGTPNVRNHFYTSFEDKTYTKFVFDWSKADNYLRLGTPVHIQGKAYPQELLMNQMPRSIKLEFFKDVLSKLTPEEKEIIEYDSPESDERAFRTEYMLEWVLDTYTFLKTYEVEMMQEGDFEPLEARQYGETYYMGVDFGGSSAANADPTAISIIRLNPNWSKDKIYTAELKGMEFSEQGKIVKHIYEIFRPVNICMDYTGIGRPIVDILMNEEGLPITPILFNQTDNLSPELEGEQKRPNFKTSMYDYFKIEINSKRFKYPKLTNIKNQYDIILFEKGLKQWTDILLHPPKNRNQINKQISAPSGKHDDNCDADVLAVFAAMISTHFVEKKPIAKKRPMGAVGGGNPYQNPNSYLKSVNINNCGFGQDQNKPPLV